MGNIIIYSLKHTISRTEQNDVETGSTQAEPASMPYKN